MNSSPTPRAALITGAGRRIGRAISRALAQAGYAVVLHAHRSRAEAEQLAGEIVGAGGQARVVLADLADPEALAKLVPAAAAFGPLTLLVNNASLFDEDEIASLDRARFERTLAVNLTAPLLLSQAFAAQAPARADASIVNITDQRVLKPTPRFFSYTLSKSALASGDRHAGAGAGAACARQRGGARPDAAEPAPVGRAICRAGGGRAAQARAQPGRHRGGGGLSRAGQKRHRHDDRGRRRPASGLAHASTAISQNRRMIPKSGNRFSDKIMRKQNDFARIMCPP